MYVAPATTTANSCLYTSRQRRSNLCLQQQVSAKTRGLTLIITSIGRNVTGLFFNCSITRGQFYFKLFQSIKESSKNLET